MSDNPFAAPTTMTSALPTVDHESLGGIAKRVFLAWEGLRLVYNGILVVQTLLLIAWAREFTVSLIVMIVIGAIFSNLAFLAGPIVETYVRWLGYTRLWPRWMMFVLGTAFTMAMAAIAIMMQ